MNSNRQLPLMTKAVSRPAPIRIAVLGRPSIRLGISAGRKGLPVGDPVGEAMTRLKRKARLYQSLAEITRTQI